MIKLTARQEQILDLIKNAIQNTGFPPTRAEIAAELGFRSANAAEEQSMAVTTAALRLWVMGFSKGSKPDRGFETLIPPAKVPGTPTQLATMIFVPDWESRRLQETYRFGWARILLALRPRKISSA